MPSFTSSLQTPPPPPSSTVHNSFSLPLLPSHTFPHNKAKNTFLPVTISLKALSYVTLEQRKGYAPLNALQL